jgi:ligand-binding sensor domain-containing protein
MNFKCTYPFHCKFLAVLFWAFIANTINFQANSQTFSAKRFTTENGLTYNRVQNIAQDKTGFLWIATWDGINRYDGYEFRNYYHRPDDSTTFPYFPVDKLLVDSKNNIWILCTFRPVFKHNRANDNFERFNTPWNQNITDIYQDEQENIWFVNSHNLYRYTKEEVTKKFNILDAKSQNPASPGDFPQLAIDNRSQMWFFNYTPNGIKVFKGNFTNDSLVQISPLDKYICPDPTTFPTRHYLGNFNVHVTKNNQTWLFSKFGLFLLDTVMHAFIPKNKIESPASFAGKSVFSWIDIHTGLMRFNPREGITDSIPNQPKLIYETMFPDKSGNIWAGTVSGIHSNTGLFRYTAINENLKHFMTGLNEQGDKNLVFPILKDKSGNIWVGTRRSDYLTKIRPDRSAEKVHYLEGFKGQNHPKVRSMVQDSSGIWMGCTENYILYYNFNTQKFSTLNDAPIRVDGKTSPLNIHNITKKNDQLIFSGWEGIYSFSLKTGEVRVEFSTEVKGSIFSMTMDQENNLWLGTQNNTIIRLDPEFKKTGAFQIGNGTNLVEHICMGDNSDLWIALMGGGLGYLDYKTGKTEIFTTADGLPNNTLYSILKDQQGNLWISTNKGLSQFNPDTRTFRTLNEHDGLLIEEFNSDSFYSATDGELFFGGVGGMVSFHPDSMYQASGNNMEPVLLITEIRISGTDRKFCKAVYELDTIPLQKGDNNIQLTFAAIDFNNANTTKYRYRMVEEGDDWTETSYRNRNVNYTNLSPGEYHFEVQCTNPKGEWNASKKIVIRIPFYYYQTRLFRIALFALFSSLLFFMTYLIFRQMKLQEAQKQNDLKLESLRGQMNPHFIFNALNSVNYFISKNDKINANSYISDFSRLIRSVLNNLSHDYIPLEQEMESIRDYLRLEHLRFSDRFDYELMSELDEMNPIKVSPGLVQPFIENAIWHGVRGLENRKGFIRVSFFKVNEDILRCMVEDDGIGRKQAETDKNLLPGKKSRGIGIVRERLRILSEINKTRLNLIIEDITPEKNDTGTRVILDLPVQNSFIRS